MKTLYAGPYDHEFGHELFSFQGYIRKQSESFERTIVSSKESMRFLYEDFVEEFVPDTKKMPIGFGKTITMEDCRSAVSSGIGNFKYEQKFVKYGSFTPEKYDVIVHARNKRGRMSINLNEESYALLLNDLSKDYSVAFIGSKGASFCPDGAVDLREITLMRLANVICSSRLVVGQSSGPVHFSSLCGTPHLTWGGYRLRTYARYAHHWNPFKTLCFLLESPDDYLQNRIRRARLPSDILDQGYFNIVETENYRQPSIKELLLDIRTVLDSSKLNEYNEKRMLRHDVELR